MRGATGNTRDSGKIVVPQSSYTVLMWPFMFLTLAFFLMQLAQGASAGVQMIYRFGITSCIGMSLLIVVGFMRERKQRITVSESDRRSADQPAVPFRDIVSIDISADATSVTITQRPTSVPLVWKLPLAITESEAQLLHNRVRSRS